MGTLTFERSVLVMYGFAAGLWLAVADGVADDALWLPAACESGPACCCCC